MLGMLYREIMKTSTLNHNPEKENSRKNAACYVFKRHTNILPFD